MKTLFTGLLVAMTGAVCLAQTAPIEIKGLRLGMTETEIKTIYPQGLREFTIGGYNAYSGRGPDLVYDENGKLAAFYFPYREDLHGTFKAVVKEKFPTIKCKESLIQIRMGATYTQESCSLFNEAEAFNITHYAGGTVETGRLMWTTRAYLFKGENNLEKRKKDM